MPFGKVMGRLVGFIDVEEKDNSIVISNVPVKDLEALILREWNSSKIAVGMFIKATRSSITLPKFFAIEFAYILEYLLANAKRLRHGRVLKRVLELLYENTWLSTTRFTQSDILDFNELKNLELKPLPHQLEFFQTYNRSVPKYQLKGFLLSSPPGTGKTFTGLALSKLLHSDLVIVVAPNNSIYNVWDKSITNQISGSPKAWVSRDGKPVDGKSKYNVFHYEALGLAVELAEKMAGKVKTPVIILDECHNFNETTAQRTEMFVKLCTLLNCQHVLWSSGTPIKAIGNEAIPLLRTIDPFFDPLVEDRFKMIFGKNAKRAVDILAHRMGILTYKVEKSSVVDIKPIITEVKVKLKNGYDYTLGAIRDEMAAFIKERTAYYKANMKRYEETYEDCLAYYADTMRSRQEEKDFALYKAHIKTIRKSYDPVIHKAIALWVNKYEKDVITPALPNAMKHEFRDCKSVIKYVSLKIQGECLGRVLGKKRSQCNVDMVNETNLSQLIDDSIKKSIVFTSYVDVVKQVDNKLKAEGYDTRLVYGETNKNVTGIVREFENDENVNPLVATFDSLSTAVPLIVANTIIMMNSPFRHYEFDQAVSRCARLGQDTQVYVFMITLDTGTEPNISTRAKDIMEWSMSQVEAIMGVKIARDDNALEASLEAYDLAVDPMYQSTPKTLLW